MLVTSSRHLLNGARLRGGREASLWDIWWEEQMVKADLSPSSFYQPCLALKTTDLLIALIKGDLFLQAVGRQSIHPLLINAPPLTTS